MVTRAKARNAAQHNNWNWYARLLGWDRGGAQRMVHPESPLVTMVQAISLLLLTYTAAVVPVIVGLKWDDIGSCWRNPLLGVDVFVDTFFLLEIVMAFCIGTYVQGIYRDDWGLVAQRYICGQKGNLLFDLVTSVPVSYVELWSESVCETGEDARESSVGLRFLRLLKIARIFRLMKVLRVVRDLAVTTRIERLLRIPAITFRLVRVTMTLAAIMHICTCTFWLAKTQSNTPEGLANFLDINNLEPNSPLVEKYMLALYFVCTIFTTVGFGDVHAENTAERALCVSLMLLGVMVFASLLSEIQTGISEIRTIRFSREKGFIVQQLKDYLRDMEVSPAMERSILHWVTLFQIQKVLFTFHTTESWTLHVEFQVDAEQHVGWEDRCKRHLGSTMAAALNTHCAKPNLDNLEVMEAMMLDSDKARIYAMLWGAADTVTFQAGQVLASAEVSPDGILIIEEGNVSVLDDEGQVVQMMRRGQVVNEWQLLGTGAVTSAWGLPVEYMAHSHVRCRCIAFPAVEGVLDQFPSARDAILERAEELWPAGGDGEVRQLESHAFRTARARWMALAKKLQQDRRRRRKRSIQSFVADSSMLHWHHGGNHLVADAVLAQATNAAAGRWGDTTQHVRQFPVGPGSFLSPATARSVAGSPEPSEAADEGSFCERSLHERSARPVSSGSGVFGANPAALAPHSPGGSVRRTVMPVPHVDEAAGVVDPPLSRIEPNTPTEPSPGLRSIARDRARDYSPPARTLRPPLFGGACRLPSSGGQEEAMVRLKGEVAEVRGEVGALQAELKASVAAIMHAIAALHRTQSEGGEAGGSTRQEASDADTQSTRQDREEEPSAKALA